MSRSMSPVQKPYTEEQFWRMYEKLPPDVKDALWGTETGDAIYDVCQKNGAQEQHADVLQLCTNVFLGLMLPQELEKALVEKAGLDQTTATNIAAQLNGLIFYPVKAGLEQLHQQVGKTDKQGSPVGIPTPRHAGRIPAASPYTVAPEEQTAEPQPEPQQETPASSPVKRRSVPRRQAGAPPPSAPPGPDVGTEPSADPYRETAE